MCKLDWNAAFVCEKHGTLPMQRAVQYMSFRKIHHINFLASTFFAIDQVSQSRKHTIKKSKIIL